MNFQEMLAEATRLEVEAAKLRTKAKPLIGKAFVDLLQKGCWKIRNETLCPADSATRKTAYTLAQATGVTWYHEAFSFYYEELQIEGKTDDGTVTFDIYKLAKLTNLRIINSNKWIRAEITEINRQADDLQTSLVKLLSERDKFISMLTKEKR